MSEPSNGDIMRALGKLEGLVEAAKDTATEEAARAATSRRVLHEKVEEASTISHDVKASLNVITFQLGATTDIAIQARDGLNSFRAKFEKEATPILDGVSTFRAEVEPLLAATRAVKNWAAAFAALAALGVISIGGAVAFFNEAVKMAIRLWLGIA